MSTNDPKRAAMEGVVAIVSAYVSHNTVEASDLAGLIRAVHRALQRPGDAPAFVRPKLTRAQIRMSILNRGLISFEDGNIYPSLKAHLSEQGLTAKAYRSKWGLPRDYPMTAPGAARETISIAGINYGRRPELRRADMKPLAKAAAPRSSTMSPIQEPDPHDSPAPGAGALQYPAHAQRM